MLRVGVGGGLYAYHRWPVCPASETEASQWLNHPVGATETAPTLSTHEDAQTIDFQGYGGSGPGLFLFGSAVGFCLAAGIVFAVRRADPRRVGTSSFLLSAE